MIINKETIENVCYACPAWKYDERLAKAKGYCTSNPRECEDIHDYMLLMQEGAKLKSLEVKLNGI
jgi:hypothetical protein